MKPYHKILCLLLLVSVKIVLTDKEFPKKVKNLAKEAEKLFSSLSKTADKLKADLNKQDLMGNHKEVVKALKGISDDSAQISQIIDRYCDHSRKMKARLDKIPKLDEKSGDFLSLAQTSIKKQAELVENLIKRYQETAPGALRFIKSIEDKLKSAMTIRANMVFKIEGVMDRASQKVGAQQLKSDTDKYVEWLAGVKHELGVLIRDAEENIGMLKKFLGEGLSFTSEVKSSLPVWLKNKKSDILIEKSKKLSSVVEKSEKICSMVYYRARG